MKESQARLGKKIQFKENNFLLKNLMKKTSIHSGTCLQLFEIDVYLLVFKYSQTNISVPPIFVLYSRDFVITMIIVTKFDRMLKVILKLSKQTRLNIEKSTILHPLDKLPPPIFFRSPQFWQMDMNIRHIFKEMYFFLSNWMSHIFPNWSYNTCKIPKMNIFHHENMPFLTI